MVPTRRFWALVALGIPLAGLFASAGAAWGIWVYNALLLAAAYLTFRMAPSVADLSWQRKFDPVLSVRVPNRIELVVKNDGVEPVAGRLREEPPPGFEVSEREFDFRLEPGRVQTFSYTVTPSERGSDFFRSTYLRVACPLGLVLRQARLPSGQPVRVYPNVLALREFDLLKQKGRLNQIGIRQTRTRGLGTEFESLRDYNLGDDYRKVDWKASARRNKLVVRQYEQERNQSVLICVDVGRRMLSEIDRVRKVDHCLDSCLMLAHAAQVAGDMVGLLVYADQVRRYIPPRKGRNQSGVIIEAIHDQFAEPVTTDAVGAFAYLTTRYKRRSLLVVFTDTEDEADARELVAALGSLGRRHLVLVVRVSDPRLKECAEGTIESVDDMYQKAAALMFTSERRRALSILQAAGLHTVDAEPHDLASALVSFYFMVKERSMI